jgi:hypothetical protein
MTRSIPTAVTAALLVLASGPARASGVDTAARAFVALHGPQTLLDLDEHGARFAGRFASQPLTGTPDMVALAFLERWHALWGLDPLADLRVSQVVTLSSLTYVRLDQEHGGVRVEGAGVVVTIDPQGRVRQAGSAYEWSGGYADSVPSLTPAMATAVAASQLPHLVATGQSRLVYLPGSSTLPLAWAIRTHSTAGPEAPELYVDAHSGAILKVLDTNVYADGNVYEINPTADPTVVTRELLNLTSTTNLDGTYAIAYACTAPDGGNMCPGRTRNAAPDGDGHYLFSPDEPSLADPFSEVMGYYHLDLINRHMEDAYGHVYTCDGHRWMDIQVNMDYENAWFGDQDDDGCRDPTMGQSSQDYTYDSAIVYHEFGHGINSTYCELRRDFHAIGPVYDGSGINEAFADYWAATLHDRPVIGEYAGIGELGFRDLSDHAVCPDDLVGESHYDSPIVSTTMWDIRTTLGRDKTDRLSLAILAALTDRPTIDEAGRTMQSQAAALEGTGLLTATDVAAVDAAVIDHGLVGCEHIVPMEHGDVHMFIIPVWRWEHDTASPNQFSMYAPPTATRLSAIIERYSSDGGYTIYVKRDSHVVMGREGPDIWVEDYDYGFTASPDRVSFTEWSDPPLEPDTTYYFTVMHNGPMMALMVEALIIAPEPEDASEDPEEDDEPDEDAPADVPDETEDDPAGEPADDVPPGPGAFTARGGCGCSLAT